VGGPLEREGSGKVSVMRSFSARAPHRILRTRRERARPGRKMMLVQKAHQPEKQGGSVEVGLTTRGMAEAPPIL